MPALQIGQIRTFGTKGPKYEITGTGHSVENNDWLVPTRVVESGEELQYPYSQLALDPEAA